MLSEEMASFNPTLVRLRQVPGPPRRRVPDRFNPTLVRLRRSSTPPGGPSSSGFNPTLVRLRHWGGGRDAGQAVHVSIPRWFD